MFELVAERGYAGVTVRGLSRTSEISTSTFYRQFANVEECFAATYRSIMRGAIDRVAAATSTNRGWEEGLRAGVRALAETVAENPHAARLVLVDSYDGGPALLREIEAATASLEHQLSAGPASLAAPLSQAIVAGVERVLRTKLLEDRQGELADLADELTEWILGVYGLDSLSSPMPAPKVSARPQQRPSSNRDDPAYAVFDAIGGDRGRILATVAKQSLTVGYWNLTLPSLRRDAGVSRSRFDNLFGDINDCYIEAVETLVTAVAGAAVRETEEAATWGVRIEQIASRFCDEFARSPLFLQLAFIDPFAPGRHGLLSRERLVGRVADWVQGSAPPQHRPPGLATEASASACWQVMRVEVGLLHGIRMGSSSLFAQIILASPRAT